jgi:2-polyprenyl-6-methoxyphenol hydroxylase-like FAD-dependent oxidoreductase
MKSSSIKTVPVWFIPNYIQRWVTRTVNDCQVIIVGGGPVGMGLAIELGQRGIYCCIIERRTKTNRIPKGQNLMQRTLDHFYCWGIVDELRAARVMPDGYPIGSITTYGDLRSEYWYKPQQREAVKDYFFQENERLPQYCTEDVLLKKIAKMSTIETYLGWRVQEVTQDKNQAQVIVSEEDSSEQKTLKADYIVGCDGAHSIVRESIGIKRSGSDFDQKMVLVVFRSKELHEGLKRFPEVSTYRAMFPEAKGYWHFFGRIDVGEGWFFHAPVPLDTTVENFDFKALLQKAAGFDFDCEFDHVGFWDLQVAVAESYQVRRIFIAGDAAHSHPPYGGFGLNNGLEDARNLGWKLAATLQGWGGKKLLSSYSSERHPIFKETGEDFIAARIERERKFLDTYDPEKDIENFQAAWGKKKFSTSKMATAYEPHYEGSSVIDGPINGLSSAHGEHRFEARAGHHLAPLTLSSGMNLFEEIGNDFCLIALGGDQKTVELISNAASAFDIPLKVIQDDLNNGRDVFGSTYILVRPDHYIVWEAKSAPKDIEKIMLKVVGR